MTESVKLFSRRWDYCLVGGKFVDLKNKNVPSNNHAHQVNPVNPSSGQSWFRQSYQSLTPSSRFSKIT
jgi:hypothetical protein